MLLDLSESISVGRRYLRITDHDDNTLISLSDDELYVHPDLTAGRLLLHLFRYHPGMTNGLAGCDVVRLIELLEKHVGSDD